MSVCSTVILSNPFRVCVTDDQSAVSCSQQLDPVTPRAISIRGVHESFWGKRIVNDSLFTLSRLQLEKKKRKNTFASWVEEVEFILFPLEWISGFILKQNQKSVCVWKRERERQDVRARHLGVCVWESERQDVSARHLVCVWMCVRKVVKGVIGSLVQNLRSHAAHNSYFFGGKIRFQSKWSQPGHSWSTVKFEITLNLLCGCMWTVVCEVFFSCVTFLLAMNDVLNISMSVYSCQGSALCCFSLFPSPSSSRSSNLWTRDLISNRKCSHFSVLLDVLCSLITFTTVIPWPPLWPKSKDTTETLIETLVVSLCSCPELKINISDPRKKNYPQQQLEFDCVCSELQFNQWWNLTHESHCWDFRLDFKGLPLVKLY